MLEIIKTFFLGNPAHAQTVEDIGDRMASGTDMVIDIGGYVVSYGLQIILLVLGVGALFFLIYVGYNKLKGTIR